MSSFIILLYDLFDPTFVYCYSFSSCVVKKCFVMKKFILGCSFSFEAYVKNVREKATKWPLKTTEVLLNADGHVHA